MKPKRPKLSTVQKKADDLQSEYIRLKYADSNGLVQCVSCGIWEHWTAMDAGHFVPKSRGAAVRYVEENVHPECRPCNRFDEGHLIGFTLFMRDTYGQDKIDELQGMARQGTSRSRQLAEEAIAYYTPLLAQLKRER